jgi:O-antigen/teichoic acid export membrane protein
MALTKSDAARPEDTTREDSPAPSVGGQGHLRLLAIRGSMLEMGGFGAAMAIRLGSNVLMSRLLFPSAFGLMALVSIFIQGLIMLSDVGIEPAVIQSNRGDEVAFLNTAWTMQVVRGISLYGLVLLLAWPLAVIYKEPLLFPLMCVGSFSLVLQGLTSTSFYTLRRRLSIGKITLVELGSQAATVAVMIPWALLRPSVWVLVGGHLASYVFRTVASHMIGVGYRNRFAVDIAARSAIVNFGKWVFGSSALFFLSRQADRLLLGRYLGAAELGVYSIAFLISDSIGSAITRITHGVLFPVFSRVRLEGDARLRDIYYRARLGLDAMSLPALGVLTMLGPWVVHLLYDRRYAEAGWILQAFSLRVAMICVLTPCETLLVSLGLSRYGFYQNGVRLIWIVITVPLGWTLYGLRGVVWAVAMSELPVFLVLWPPARRLRMLRALPELRAAGFYLAGILIGWFLSLALAPTR